MNAVDTNVFVYAVDFTEPARQACAVALLKKLTDETSEPTVLLWQVTVEYVACLRRWESLKRISRSDTMELVESMQTTFDCVMPTPDSINMALQLSSRFSLSHWDSLLIAACIEAGVTTLYSEDLSAGMSYDSVTVINPFVP